MPDFRFRISGSILFSGAVMLVLLIGGCRSLRLPYASDLESGAWPVSGGSAERPNAADRVLAPPFTLTWTYDAEAGFGPMSPLVAGGSVLVGTRRGEVHAIGLVDGTRQGFISVGESVEGAAALREGALIGASAEGKHPLFRYDLRAGTMAWRADTAPVLAGVLVEAQIVVVADAGGTVAAFDARTGVQRWAHRPERAASFRAAPVSTPAGFFVADDRGGQWLLDRSTGAVRWTRTGAGPAYATPASKGDTIFVATTRGRLEALDARTGDVRWCLALPDTTMRLTAPAVLGADVVVAGTDGAVRLLDAATGAERWMARGEGAIVAPPLLTRDVVLVGTMDRMLRALSRRDGAVLWEYELRGRMKSAMALAGQSLIVLSEPRFVYRFDPATP